jgi:hypothetical protein
LLFSRDTPITISREVTAPTQWIASSTCSGSCTAGSRLTWRTRFYGAFSDRIQESINFCLSEDLIHFQPSWHFQLINLTHRLTLDSHTFLAWILLQTKPLKSLGRNS